MLRYEVQSPIISRSRLVRVEKRVRFTRTASRYLREEAWQRVAAAANLDLIREEVSAVGGVRGLWKRLWRKAA